MMGIIYLFVTYVCYSNYLYYIIIGNNFSINIKICKEFTCNSIIWTIILSDILYSLLTSIYLVICIISFAYQHLYRMVHINFEILLIAVYFLIPTIESALVSSDCSTLLKGPVYINNETVVKIKTK